MMLIDEPRAVFAVADGLGGLPGGEVASRTAIETIRRALNCDDEKKCRLEDLVQRAHSAVQEAGLSFGTGGIGTTLTMVRLEDDAAHIAHVGDSFALLIRGGECRPLTREHNIENDRSDIFALAPHPPGFRYALTRVVGQPEAFRPDVIEERLLVDDRLVLATDGLTDMIDFPEIAALCSKDNEPRAIAEGLVAAANGAGGRDNITVVVIVIDAR
jgi:protein phosphatase